MSKIEQINIYRLGIVRQWYVSIRNSKNWFDRFDSHRKKNNIKIIDNNNNDEKIKCKKIFKRKFNFHAIYNENKPEREKKIYHVKYSCVKRREGERERALKIAHCLRKKFINDYKVKDYRHSELNYILFFISSMKNMLTFFSAYFLLHNSLFFFIIWTKKNSWRLLIFCFSC